jgi:hypothetical protein
MIGKPYAGELHVRFDEGNRTLFYGRFYTGTKLETADTAKNLPNERCACSLLYPSVTDCRCLKNLRIILPSRKYYKVKLLLLLTYFLTYFFKSFALVSAP